jgi:hypothetical protein
MDFWVVEVVWHPGFLLLLSRQRRLVMIKEPFALESLALGIDVRQSLDPGFLLLDVF